MTPSIAQNLNVGLAVETAQNPKNGSKVLKSSKGLFFFQKKQHGNTFLCVYTLVGVTSGFM